MALLDKKRTRIAATPWMIALLASCALALSACGRAKIPENHLANLQLSRAWQGLEAGTHAVTLKVHAIDSGQFEVRIYNGAGDAGTELTRFLPADLRHEYSFERIPEHPTVQRSIDTFVGKNDADVQINGTVTVEDTAHWVNNTLKDAFLLQTSFDLRDASGYIGKVVGSETDDWYND